MTFRRFVLASTSIAALGLPLGFCASPAHGADCRVIELQGNLGWISSATWVPSLSSVVVVNSFSSEVRAYSPDGSYFVPENIELGSPEPVIGSIGKAGDGFLLRSLGDKFFRLRDTLAVRDAKDFSAFNLKTTTGIGSIYQWSAGSTQVFAFGSLVKEGGGFDLGFFSTPIENPAAARMVKPFERGDYYTLGNPYTVSLGADFFFLLMGKEVHLYRQGKEGLPRDLGPLPKDFRSAPDFKTPMSGPSSAKARFEEIETLSIPAGIYSQGGELYLLARNPGRDNKTQWNLHRLDTNTGRVTGSVRLPTSSSHVTLVPSPDAWYVFERGRIIGPNQRQAITRMLSINAAAIRVMEMPKDCIVER